MLPYLVKSDREGQAGPSSQPLVPPLHFRPLKDPTQVRWNPAPGVAVTGGTESQRLGLKYEMRIHRGLRGLFPFYVANPYIHFLDDSVSRTCQPDAVLFLDPDIFIFEIKYQHCPEAWWQLERLYKPLIQLRFFQRPVYCVEICRSYDPSTPFPCPVELVKDLVDWTSESRPSFGVFQWKV